MPRRSCECVKQIHMTRSMQAMHESTISRNYNEVNLTKHGKVCNVFLKKIYLAVI